MLHNLLKYIQITLDKKSYFKDELKPRQLINSLVGSLVIAISEIFLGISLASLVFKGPLESHFPMGAGLVLASLAILFSTITIFSSRAGSVPIAQDVTAVLIGVITSSLAGSITSDEMLPTTLAAVAVGTLLAGLALVGVGILKLGVLIRYLPYPVLGGFLAATGFLLVSGSLSSLTGIETSFPNIAIYLQDKHMLLWLPALVIGIAIFLAVRKINNPLAFPGVIVSIVAIFYLTFAASGISVNEAIEMGFLYRGDTLITWYPLTPALLSQVNWDAIFHQAGNIAALVGMTMVGLLLNLSALEAAQGEEFRLNREVTLTGIANVLIGLAGGFIGYHSVSTSNLGARIGLRSRISGAFMAGLCLFTLWAGTAMLSFIPRPLVSGILLFLGFDFLYDWVITGWKRFSRVEYLIVLLILGVIIATDFLTGVIFGLMATVTLFIVSYSQTKVYRIAASGAVLHSKVVRSAEQISSLASHGEEIYVLELQGFLFFGTANALLDQVKYRINNPDLKPLRFLVMDFRMVTGIDTSAALAFYKGARLTRSNNITIVLTHASKEILFRLQRGGFNTNSPDILHAEDLDRGLEWCEERLLESLGAEATSMPASVSELFELQGMAGNEIQQLMAYLKEEFFEKGAHLWQKGDPADDLFYVVRGRVSIYRENSDGSLIRISTLGPGTSIGEIGLYLGASRSAAVIADEPTEGFRLTRQALEDMQENNPRLSSTFHTMIARQLAGWVLQANQSLEELRKSV